MYAGKDFQQGRFSCTVLSGEPQNLMLAYTHADIFQCMDTREPFGDPVYLQKHLIVFIFLHDRALLLCVSAI